MIASRLGFLGLLAFLLSLDMLILDDVSLLLQLWLRSFEVNGVDTLGQRHSQFRLIFGEGPSLNL